MSADILGPANVSGATTTRPTDGRTFGSTDTWFQNCSSDTADDGTEFPAEWFNAIMAQLKVAIRAGQITQSVLDDTMLAQAIAAASVRGAVDTSTAANTILIAPTPAITSLSPWVSFRVKVANAVTGATQVNVSGVGLHPLVRWDGSAIQQGDIVASQVIEMAWDGSTSFYLQSQGAKSILPTNAAGLLANDGAGGLTWASSILAIRLIQSSGSYTQTAGTLKFHAEAIGGGGSGGGGESNTAGAAASGGGGAGGRARKLFTVVAGQTGTCTIGTGGASVTHTNNGNAGGTTTFVYNGVTLTANGGAGGITANSSGTGGLGGTASGGDVNLQGDPGHGGTQAGFPSQSGNGGASPYGTAGRGGFVNSSSTATAGVNGAGGGGGNGGTGAYDNSGSGGNGLIMIVEYH